MKSVLKNRSAIGAFAAACTFAAASTLSAAVYTVNDDSGPMTITSFDTLVIEDGGKLGSNSFGKDESTINLNDGTIDTNFTLMNDAKMNIRGGTINDGLVVQDKSLVNFYHGTLNSFTTKGTSQTRIWAGTLAGDITVTEDSKLLGAYGQITGNITVSDNAQLITAGGTFDGNFKLTGNSYSEFRGGIYNGSITLEDSARLNISEGMFTGTMIESMSADSTLNLTGFDFQLDGIAITEADLDDSNFLNYTGKSVLTGRFANNQLFSINLDDDVLGRFIVNDLNAIPEPASLALITLGLTAVFSRRSCKA